MSLSSDTRLGPYEIIRAIGAGGMGEVYRGRDASLNRDVAIKVGARSGRARSGSSPRARPPLAYSRPRRPAGRTKDGTIDPALWA